MSRSAVITLGALLACSTAQATTLRALSSEELATAAERIVLGTLESRASYWDGTRIYTRHVIQVEETWHGPPTDRLEVLTLGGVVGAIGQRVVGTARLRVGDRVVLFLAAGGGEELFTIGMAQGAFHVEEGDPEGSDTSAPELIRPATGLHLVGETPIRPQTLGALRALVEEARRVP